MQNTLCEDCNRRLKTNPIRVLDCKNDSCKQHVRSAFKTIEFLCPDCKNHFEEVLKFLNLSKIKYEIDPYIVRGLDYYTRTVFEIVHEDLGSQNAIGAGGRYDNLISDMGGPFLGACGFAVGVDRMLLILEKSEGQAVKKEGLDIFVAALGKAAYDKAFLLSDDLRGNKISCDLDFENRSLKAQMRTADRLGAKYVLIIGDDEVAKGEAVLRNMQTKEQSSVKFADVVKTIKAAVRGSGTW